MDFQRDIWKNDSFQIIYEEFKNKDGIVIETGDIIEFVDDRIEEIQEEIAKKKGYKIIKHVHQLFVKPIKNEN